MSSNESADTCISPAISINSVVTDTGIDPTTSGHIFSSLLAPAQSPIAKTDSLPDSKVSSIKNDNANDNALSMVKPESKIITSNIPSSTEDSLGLQADETVPEGMEPHLLPVQDNKQCHSVRNEDILVVTDNGVAFEEISDGKSKSTLTSSDSNPTSVSASESNVTIKQEPTDILKIASFQHMQSVGTEELYSSDSTDTSDEESVAGPTALLNHDDDVGDINNRKTHSKFTSKTDALGPLVPGELTISDLPPIEDLKIDIDEKVELCELGDVMSIVDCLVIVKASRGIPALDEETALFMEGRKFIGKIFETFGPVVSPFYSVRFNSVKDIENSEIKAGDKVFFAPKEERPLTAYVFLDKLKTLKGSDASWVQNLEPPDQYIDYSDDEQERQAKAKHKAKNRKPESTNHSNQTDNSKRVRQHQHGMDGLETAHSSQTPNHRNSGGYVRPPVRHARPCRPSGDPLHHRQFIQGPPPRNMWGDQGHYRAFSPVHYARPPYTVPAPSGFHPSGFPPVPLPGFGNAPPAFHAGWQSYGGSWTDQDTHYYSEQPKKLDVSFVDIRYMQQQSSFKPRGSKDTTAQE